MNPDTGEAAYIISGGLAGGDSTSGTLVSDVKAWSSADYIAAEKQIAAIENAIELDLLTFPGPDNSIGTADDVRLIVIDEEVLGGRWFLRCITQLEV